MRLFAFELQLASRAAGSNRVGKEPTACFLYFFKHRSLHKTQRPDRTTCLGVPARCCQPYNSMVTLRDIVHIVSIYIKMDTPSSPASFPKTHRSSLLLAPKLCIDVLNVNVDVKYTRMLGLFLRKRTF